MDAQRLWEAVISEMRREAELVHDMVVAARERPAWFKYLPFAAVLIGAKALHLLAMKMVQVSACADHISTIVTIWMLSASALLIVAARWFWVRQLGAYLSAGGQYGKDRRALKESAEALCAAVPAGMLRLRMELLLAIIEDLPPASYFYTDIFFEAAFLVVVSLPLVVAMAAQISEQHVLFEGS